MNVSVSCSPSTRTLSASVRISASGTPRHFRNENRTKPTKPKALVVACLTCEAQFLSLRGLAQHRESCVTHQPSPLQWLQQAFLGAEGADDVRMIVDAALDYLYQPDLNVDQWLSDVMVLVERYRQTKTLQTALLACNAATWLPTLYEVDEFARDVDIYLSTPNGRTLVGKAHSLVLTDYRIDLHSVTLPMATSSLPPAMTSSTPSPGRRASRWPFRKSSSTASSTSSSPSSESASPSSDSFLSSDSPSSSSSSPSLSSLYVHRTAPKRFEWVIETAPIKDVPLEITAADIMQLVRALYNVPITVSGDNVAAMCALSLLHGVKHVREQCLEFLVHETENISLRNCISLMTMADLTSTLAYTNLGSDAETRQWKSVFESCLKVLRKALSFLKR